DDITKPLSAARKGVIEQGIYDAHTGFVTRPRFISSREFSSSDGSPGAVVDGGIAQAWSLPESANASIACLHLVPTDATKIDVEVYYWSRGTGGASNACLRLDYQIVDDGTTVNNINTGTKVACAVAAQYIAKK